MGRCLPDPFTTTGDDGYFIGQSHVHISASLCVCHSWRPYYTDVLSDSQLCDGQTSSSISRDRAMTFAATHCRTTERENVFQTLLDAVSTSSGDMSASLMSSA